MRSSHRSRDCTGHQRRTHAGLGPASHPAEKPRGRVGRFGRSQYHPDRVNLLWKKKIVLLGGMTPMCVAGVVWQTLHYLLGFRRLGYDVYYVEAHARTPAMLMRSETDDSSAR